MLLMWPLEAMVVLRYEHHDFQHLDVDNCTAVLGATQIAQRLC